MPAIPPFFPGLPDFPAIDRLKEFRQWVSWRIEIRDGNPTKPPINPHTGRHAKSTDPVTWGGYEDALTRTWRDRLAGVGFVLAQDDGFIGYDLDDCRNDKTGRIEPWAKSILALAETYAEVSPSGTGIRLIGIGKIDSAATYKPAGVEIYSTGRYLTITGHHIAGTPTEILPSPKTTEALLARIAEFKPAEPTGPSPPAPQADNFFRNVNDLAFKHLSAWVPSLFPHAKFQLGTKGYRVSSKSLGRVLQEDLSITPEGAVDFGVHDMGDSRGGRRTAIDLVEEFARLPPKDAAFWLCDRLGVKPAHLGWQESDPIAAASQRNLAARLHAPGEVAETGFEARLRLRDLSGLEFPTDPLTPAQLGGTLQWVAEETIAMSRRPVPAYATAAAIMFGAVMFGRAWRGFTNTSLSLFTIISGRSGQGKSWPVNAVRLLASECGMASKIGGRQPTSDSAIEKRLATSPCLLYCIDEIGKMFERLGASRAGNHERKVMDIMLELWGQGTMPWSGKDAASEEADRGGTLIWYPTLSLFGATTIEPFFRAMNEANVKDGMFARLLVISTEERPEEVESAADNFSDDMRNAIADCWQASLGRHGVSGNIGAASVRMAALRPPVEKVEASMEAEAAVKQIERWAHRVSDDDEEISGIVNRSAEMTVRLASIRALSRNPKAPMADLGDVKWAWTIVRRSLSFIAYGITRHMAGSEFEAIKKAMLRALEKAGRTGLPRSLLFKASGVRQAKPQEQVAALASLIETLEVEEDRQEGATKPLTRYRLLKP